MAANEEVKKREIRHHPLKVMFLTEKKIRSAYSFACSLLNTKFICKAMLQTEH